MTHSKTRQSKASISLEASVCSPACRLSLNVRYNERTHHSSGKPVNSPLISFCPYRCNYNVEQICFFKICSICLRSKAANRERVRLWSCKHLGSQSAACRSNYARRKKKKMLSQVLRGKKKKIKGGDLQSRREVQRQPSATASPLQPFS